MWNFLPATVNVYKVYYTLVASFMSLLQWLNEISSISSASEGGIISDWYWWDGSTIVCTLNHILPKADKKHKEMDNMHKKADQ